MYKFLLGLLVLGLFIGFLIQVNKKGITNILPSPASSVLENLGGENKRVESLSVVAQNFDTPWSIAFLPSGNMLVTERPGKLNEISFKNGDKVATMTINNVKEIGEGGLLGVTLDPNYQSNNYIYLYYTYKEEDGKNFNRVVRVKYSKGSLGSEEILVNAIPGASNHNGGRIKFGPDKNLYITTGDADNPSQAQDKNSLSGKVLRVTTDGKAAAGNPFNNLVYSMGHRNPQGITWDKDGTLWETEHGRSGALSGLDELNKIESGKNYGWKIIEGDEVKEGLVTPVINSGATNTWAPAGIAYFNGNLYWGGLRGQALYKGVINGGNVNLSEHFKNQYGRIRDVVLGPDNMLYITTSNQDGRATPKSGDDKIIRIDPKSL